MSRTESFNRRSTAEWKKWKVTLPAGPDFFAKRLQHAQKLVHTHIRRLYCAWTDAEFPTSSEQAHAVTAENLQAALVQAVGTGWLEAWIGTTGAALTRLENEIIRFLQDFLKQKQQKDRRLPGNHGNLEVSLKGEGGIRSQSFAPGEKIEAQWCDGHGRIAKVTKGGRKVVEHPGWHPGVITGPGPADRPATHAIDFDDGSSHPFTPADKIRPRM